LKLPSVMIFVVVAAAVAGLASLTLVLTTLDDLSLEWWLPILKSEIRVKESFTRATKKIDFAVGRDFKFGILREAAVAIITPHWLSLK